MGHLCKTFRYTSFPLPLPPSPRPFLVYRGRGDRSKTLDQIVQIDISPISRTRYLHWVSTECCGIFKIGKVQNYLGRKPLKFAIYEIFSLLFS